MRKFSRYKKDIIAKYHYTNWWKMLDTINKFCITYKELYKIIDTSMIFNFREVNWVRQKKCPSCLVFKDYNIDNYYKRNKGNSFYSSCKYCMAIMAKNYRILNREKIYQKNKEYAKGYYESNKKWILDKKKVYYIKNKETILSKKKEKYNNKKMKFIRDFLIKITK